MSKGRGRTAGQHGSKRKVRILKRKVSGSTKESTSLEKTEGDRGANLPVKQHMAAVLVANGQSIADVAAHLEVDPSTVHRWKRNSPQFRARLNEFKQQILDAAQSQLVATTIQAARNVSDEIAKGDPAISFRLLDKLGILAPPTLGSDDSVTQGHDSMNEHYQRTIGEGNLHLLTQLVDALEKDQGDVRKEIEAALKGFG